MEITREMDMTEEDKKLLKVVNIKSSELSSFIGSDVIITLKGDQRDHPSIYGIVRGVNCCINSHDFRRCFIKKPTHDFRSLQNL